MGTFYVKGACQWAHIMLREHADRGTLIGTLDVRGHTDERHQMYGGLLMQKPDASGHFDGNT